MEVLDNSLSTNDKNNAMFCHLASFAAYILPFGNILGPVLVWQIKKDTAEFVDEHGKESVNFQITFTIIVLVLILFIVGVALSFAVNEPGFMNVSSLIIAAIVLAFMGLYNLILVILASIKASQGNSFRYPLTIRFIR